MLKSTLKFVVLLVGLFVLFWESLIPVVFLFNTQSDAAGLLGVALLILTTVGTIYGTVRLTQNFLYDLSQSTTQSDVS